MGLTDENNAANFFIYPIKGRYAKGHERCFLFLCRKAQALFADEKAVRAGEQPSFFEIRGGIFFAFLIGLCVYIPLFMNIIFLWARTVVACECLFSDLRYICNTCTQVANRYIMLILKR